MQLTGSYFDDPRITVTKPQQLILRSYLDHPGASSQIPDLAYRTVPPPLRLKLEEDTRRKLETERERSEREQRTEREQRAERSREAGSHAVTPSVRERSPVRPAESSVKSEPRSSGEYLQINPCPVLIPNL